MSCKSSSFIKTISILHFLLSSIQSINAKEKSFSTSISAMVQLIDVEMKLIDCVENYIKELQNKVEALQNLINVVREETNISLQNRENYLSNPLQSFSLIRRLHNDWPKIELFMTTSVGEEHLILLKKYKPTLPTNTDLMEASSAILRLQNVYALTVADLVKGILRDQQYDSNLKSIDAYFIGSYLFSKGGYDPAGLWLYYSILNYEQDHILNEIVKFGKEKPLALYAEILLKQNRFKDALKYIKKAADLNPLDSDLWNRKNDIQFLAITKTDAPKQFRPPAITNYELGCRGHFINRTSNLFCLFNTTTTPFLLLAPLKMEILSTDPYIVIFHDVLFPREIEHIKDLTNSHLTRAQVYDEKLKGIVNEARTSHTATLRGDSDEITARVERRIIDMTGFDVKDSEHLSVVNYGIGGHYEVHYDFFNVSDEADIVAQEGDRIATVLFYLSDVEQGGATVFPNLKLAVLPRKGSALMWYNINNRMEPDAQTLHAACPVLKGSKWVCTKWIRARYQTFKKPCYK